MKQYKEGGRMKEGKEGGNVEEATRLHGAEKTVHALRNTNEEGSTSVDGVDATA